MAFFFVIASKGALWHTQPMAGITCRSIRLTVLPDFPCASTLQGEICRKLSKNVEYEK